MMRIKAPAMQVQAMYNNAVRMAVNLDNSKGASSQTESALQSGSGFVVS